MGTVCASALLGGLVDLDVLDDQGTSVETLSISVGLGVLEQTEKELGRLDGPAGLGNTELLACRSPVSMYAVEATSFSLGPNPPHLQPDSVHHFPTPGVGARNNPVSYLGQCGRWSQRSGAWGRPPCAP